MFALYETHDGTSLIIIWFGRKLFWHVSPSRHICIADIKVQMDMEYFYLYILGFILSTRVLIMVETSDVPCLKKFCNCNKQQRSAKCNLLGYIPKLPNYVVKLELENNLLSHIDIDTFRNVSNNNLHGWYSWTTQ